MITVSILSATTVFDFSAVHGQPVYAAHDGTCYPEIDSQGGNGIVLLTDKQFDDGKGGQCFYKTIYWHLTQDDAVVKTSQQVKAGDLIGYADNTGLSTGDHLHFGLKQVQNNEPAFAWITLNPDNGYLGAIDPTPYFNGLYAQDIHNEVPFKHTFTEHLQFGDSGDEVKALQQALILDHCLDPRYITGYFGNLTKAAVIAFQDKYFDEILIPAGLSYATGVVGDFTIKKLNQLYG